MILRFLRRLRRRIRPWDPREDLRQFTVSELQDLYRNQVVEAVGVPQEYWEDYKRERGFGRRRL